MSKLKILLLAAALGFTVDAVAQAQVQVKQQCSYRARLTRTVRQILLARCVIQAPGGLLLNFNRSSASTKAGPFQTAQQMLKGRYVTR
jgi:hypothetical protein